MPAAAVIPAPIAYTKVVAVKKLVVERLNMSNGLPHSRYVPVVQIHPRRRHACHSLGGYGSCVIYCEQNRVFKAGLSR